MINGQPWRDQASLMYRRSVPKGYDWVFTGLKFGQVTKISKPYQVRDFTSQDIRTVDTASDWLIVNLGTVNCFDELNTLQ